jgi:hypothetical protein
MVPVMIRFVQIACIVVTALILFGIGKSLDIVGSLVGPGFDGGFIVGAVFMAVLYGLACWIDPASRPRGNSSASEQHRFRDGLD